MQVFYAPDIEGNTYILDKQESRHLIKVLRTKKSDPVKLIDGKGNLYEGIIAIPDSERCIIKISNVIKEFGKRNYRLHLAVSPLKNPERFEWMIEKCVEIGVDEITPIICQNSEKKTIRTERINKIIISAMKQSVKAYITLLHQPVTFEELINQKSNHTCLIAHCNRQFERKSINTVYNTGSDVLILIGPEGDFTEKEISIAINKGFVSVHLGASRLRTETAAIAACHSIYFMNQLSEE